MKRQVYLAMLDDCAFRGLEFDELFGMGRLIYDPNDISDWGLALHEGF